MESVAGDCKTVRFGGCETHYFLVHPNDDAEDNINPTQQVEVAETGGGGRNGQGRRGNRGRKRGGSKSGDDKTKRKRGSRGSKQSRNKLDDGNLPSEPENQPAVIAASDHGAPECTQVTRRPDVEAQQTRVEDPPALLGSCPSVPPRQLVATLPTDEMLTPAVGFTGLAGTLGAPSGSAGPALPTEASPIPFSGNDEDSVVDDIDSTADDEVVAIEHISSKVLVHKSSFRKDAVENIDGSDPNASSGTDAVMNASDEEPSTMTRVPPEVQDEAIGGGHADADTDQRSDPRSKNNSPTEQMSVSNNDSDGKPQVEENVTMEYSDDDSDEEDAESLFSPNTMEVFVVGGIKGAPASYQVLCSSKRVRASSPSKRPPAAPSKRICTKNVRARLQSERLLRSRRNSRKSLESTFALAAYDHECDDGPPAVIPEWLQEQFRANLRP